MPVAKKPAAKTAAKKPAAKSAAKKCAPKKQHINLIKIVVAIYRQVLSNLSFFRG